jgi:hypothetical protein
MRLLTVHGKIPIGPQFLLMDLRPCLNKPHLAAGQLAVLQLQGVNQERCLALTVVGVKVRRISPPLSSATRYPLLTFEPRKQGDMPARQDVSPSCRFASSSETVRVCFARSSSRAINRAFCRVRTSS